MNWKTLLKQQGVLVSDGAWGTQLAERGLPAGAVPETWNADCPDAVEAVARAYVEAGSDIILTNTFGGSRLKLAKVGLADRTADLNRRGAEISRRAAGDRALVLASIGPTGELLAPLGTLGRDEFIDAFAEQIAACIEGGAHGVCIETMAALEEAEAALLAARQVAAMPVVVSMTFSQGPKGFATMMGVRPEQAAAALTEAGADIVGSNCGNGIAGMIEVARGFRAATDLPLWLKPNAGMPRLVGDKTVFPESPDEMAGKVAALVEAGANFVGGCCGTTPAHIRAMAAAARQARDAALTVSRKVLDTL